MKAGFAKVACTTIAGFSTKIDRLLERKRAKRVGAAEPDLPVLSALSGTYRRMSGSPLPVIEQAVRLVWDHDGRDGTRQIFAPPPGGGTVVVMGWRAPVGTIRTVRSERRAV